MSRKNKAPEFTDETYDIQVTGHNVRVTEPMKEYAAQKLSKIDKFSLRFIEASIVMDVEKLQHKVDMMVKVDNIKIKSSAVTDDMYASIDLAADRLQSQIRKYKARIQDHHAKGVSAVEIDLNVIRPLTEAELFEVNDEIESETRNRLYEQFRPKQLIAQEKKPLKTLNLHEAMMKLELSGDQFLLYRSEEDRNLKLLYKRKDGNYGILEPKDCV